MLVGVTVMTYVLKELRFMMYNIKELVGDIDEKEKLEMFFGVLKNYNCGKSMDVDLVNRISEFMEMKWKTDKNNFLLSE